MSKKSAYDTSVPLWERVFGPALTFVLLTIPEWLEKKLTPPVVSKVDQEKMIQAAIDFWANPLEQGSMSGIGSASKGMDGIAAGLLMLAVSQATPTIHSKTGIMQFRQNLHRRIQDIGQTGIQFGTDYGPEYLLSEALEGTGLNVGLAFPMKTSVHIDYENGVVTARQVHGDREVLCKVPVSQDALAARRAQEQRRR